MLERDLAVGGVFVCPSVRPSVCYALVFSLFKISDRMMMQFSSSGSPVPISRHFRDCKSLLVASLTHVSGAITSVWSFTFTFTFMTMFVCQNITTKRWQLCRRRKTSRIDGQRPVLRSFMPLIFWGISGRNPHDYAYDKMWRRYSE